MSAVTENNGARSSPAPPIPDAHALKQGRKLSSAALYALAGVAVTFGCLANEMYSSLRGALSFFVIGLLLGLVAVYRSGKESCDPPPSAKHKQKVPVASLWVILALLIGVHVLLAVQLCRKLHPVIDTYTFQRDATKLLLSGVDPYGTTQPNPFGATGARYYGDGMLVDGRVQLGFQYPPLSLLWGVPGYLLGDVRFSYIFAIVLSAVLLFAAYPNLRTFWVVTALLLNFVTVRVEFYCWTESLVLLTVCATLFAAARCPRLLFIPLGLFLVAKQYDFLALPFVTALVASRGTFSWKAYWKLIASACGVGAVTFGPFLFWNPRGLWHDVFYTIFLLPFRHDSISFSVLAPVLLRIGPFLLLAYLFWAFRSAARNVGSFAAAFAIALLIAFLMGKQAFLNYYFLIANLLLLYPAVESGISLVIPRPTTFSTHSAA